MRHRPRHRFTAIWHQFLVTLAGLTIAVAALGLAILYAYGATADPVDAIRAP